MSKDSKVCLLFSGCCVFLLFGFLAISSLSSIEEFNSLDEKSCNITRVEYPITIPSDPNSNNWVICECGRYCLSWAPCIKLYASIEPDLVIQHEYGMDYECSFKHDCPVDNSIGYFTRILNETVNSAKHLNNSQINCYYHEEYIENIYLNASLSYNVYAFCAIGFLVGLYGSVCIIVAMFL